MKSTIYILFCFCVSVAGFADTLHVPNDYATVQDAVNAAADHDTVFVASGTYFENVSIPKPLTLMGADKNTTRLDANILGSLITITADDVMVSGFSLQNSGPGWPDSGILCMDSEGHTLSDNIVSDSFLGITFIDVSHSSIVGCEITRITSKALRVLTTSGTCSHISITDNQISDAKFPIYVENALQTSVLRNQICDTIKGSYLLGTDMATISDNTLENTVGLYLDKTRKVMVSGNSILNNIGGITFEKVTDSRIENNYVSGGSHTGISVARSHDNYVSTNTVVNKEGIGLSAFDSSGNVFFKNTCTNCSYGARDGSDSHNNIYSQQMISQARYAGILVRGDYTVVSENVIQDSLETGIELLGVHARVYGNTVSGSVLVGISLDHGINKVFHNNLHDNGQNALSYISYSFPWDFGFPAGGNYWDDYTGTDMNADGIGDQPYPIPGGGEDRYPLMFPYELSLDAECRILEESQGGTITFSLFAGSAQAGRNYMLLGGVTGLAPGTLLPGGHAQLPINWDLFSDLVLAMINTPIFQDFSGTLDTEGRGIAVLDTLGSIPGTAGIRMSFAYGVFPPWDFASNPVMITIME